jgi:AcrR family transcriptional regulator
MLRMPIEQRRHELVAAALRVVTRHGVAAATTRAIATEADMPLGAVHYAFTSHDDLMDAVIEAVVSGERATAEAHAETAETVEGAVRSGLEAYVRLLESDPLRELAVLELAVVARRRGQGERMRAQYRGYLDAATTMLERVAEQTGSRWTSPVGDLARHLVTIIDGITTTWLADGDSAAARKTAAFAARAFAAHAVASDDAPTG